MALTKTVTKLWPTRNLADGRYRVGIHLRVEDAATVVIDQDVPALYGGTHTVQEVQTRVQTAAQQLIDKYKAEKALNANAAYISAVAAIDAALTL